MNMQNKLHTIQVFSLPNDHLHSQSQSSDFAKKSLNSLKSLNSQKKAHIPAPWPTPIYTMSLMSMVWSISTGQRGLAAWLCSLPAPAHLLIS